MSFELEHLKETKDRLMAWLMHDVGDVSRVHEWVGRGWENVSKACQIMAENEEAEEEEREGDGAGSASGVGAIDGAGDGGVPGE